MCQELDTKRSVKSESPIHESYSEVPMSRSAPDQIFQKVDAFLKAALAEQDLAARAKLLGKAVYWNEMLAKAEGVSYRGRA